MLEDPTLMLRGLINNAPALYIRLTLNRLIDYIVEDSEVGATYNPVTDEVEFEEGSDQSRLNMWDIMEILAQGLLTGGEVDLWPDQPDSSVDRSVNVLSAEDIERIVNGETTGLYKNENNEEEN